ncbi:MAG: polysaccharide biosynthesis protein [Clostridiales bacterium]|nr:polysaccharide biosynthesis protein [Clostridiales bacterium]
MSARRERNYLKGAAILAGAAVAAKIIGALFKIPLYNILGDPGSAIFNHTYNIYTLLLTISYAGIPVALSRLVSVSVETGNTRQTAKYFRVALPAFALVGAVASVCMFIFAPQLALFVEDPYAELGIRVLSPAVFLCCVISVYEGFSQGHGDMIPTAVKQFVEVSCKLIFGLAVAVYLANRSFKLEQVSAGAIVGVVVGLVLAFPLMIYFKAKRYPPEPMAGVAKSSRDTLASVMRVSIPIALGASLMNLLTLVDSKVVMMRLMEGVGMSRDAALDTYGVYSKSLTLFNLTPALVSPITVSMIPALSAFANTNRRREARFTAESAIKLVSLIAMPAGIGIAVLAKPIYGALYNSHEGTQILMFLGIASIFVCAQLLLTGILQANGLERVPMFSFLAGGVIQIVCDWILVGTPAIGIVGSPIGTLACYTTITLINISVIIAKVPSPPRFLRSAGKPAIAAVVMGVGAFSAYGLMQQFLGDTLGTGRFADIVYTALAVAIAVIIYLVIVVASRALTQEDMKLLPKGDKLAKLLRLKD